MKTTQTHHGLKLLLMAVLTSSLLGCGTPSKAVASGTGAATGEVLRAPLKIPMPLDKAGHKVDVIFDIPEPSRGERAMGYFLGLRILFAPATGQVKVLDANPVAVRVKLYRVDADAKVPVRLVLLTDVARGSEPSRFEPIPLKDDVAIARGMYSEHSGALPGTHDASTYVMEFAGPRGDAPGRYHLTLETLKDIPALHGVRAFLAFEQGPKR